MFTFTEQEEEEEEGASLYRTHQVNIHTVTTPQSGEQVPFSSPRYLSVELLSDKRDSQCNIHMAMLEHNLLIARFLIGY